MIATRERSSHLSVPPAKEGVCAWVVHAVVNGELVMETSAGDRSGKDNHLPEHPVSVSYVVLPEWSTLSRMQRAGAAASKHSTFIPAWQCSCSVDPHRFCSFARRYVYLFAICAGRKDIVGISPECTPFAVAFDPYARSAALFFSKTVGSHTQRCRMNGASPLPIET
ncbi:MAG: hypothetical protein IPI00_06360, partial [Flavobacteriales bacterium]|nr:hypothetical protein [Flavobacteriales bacterium]